MTSIATTDRSSRARGKPPPHRLAFLREFLRAPRVLGTCFTSSEHLGRAMVEGIGVERAGAVVEFGPGTGAVTRAILERVPPGCRFIAIERNEGLAQHFRERFPGVTLVEDDAANVRAVCRRNGIQAADCIVSGLPWLLFPPALQRSILRATVETLRPGGGFSAVTYNVGRFLPSVRRFRGLMESFFTDVTVSRIVWRNIPPAFVYRCRK